MSRSAAKRSLSLAVIAGLFVCSLVLATYALMSPRYDRNELIIDPPEQNLGVVKPSIITRSFRVSNATSRAVHVERVITSCGCTHVQVTGKPIAPGETVEVECRIDTRGRHGQLVAFFQLVYKSAGEDTEKRLKCVLSATIDADFRVAPESLEFPVQEASTQSLRLSSHSGQTHVTNVFSDHRAFETQLSPDSQTITIRFRPELWTQGEGAASIYIQTSSNAEKTVRVPVYILRQRSLNATSKPVDSTPSHERNLR